MNKDDHSYNIMKKPVFTILISILTLSAVNAWLSFYQYLNSFQLVLFFFILFGIISLISSQIRHFLTLPDILWANIVTRVVLLAVLFIIVDTFIGGIKINALDITSTTFLGIISIIKTTLSPTISAIIGSVFVGSLSEIIIYLGEKQ